MVAKIAGLMGICLVGRASAQGELEPLAKCRGEKRAIDELFQQICEVAGKPKKVRIAHCDNLAAAQSLKEKLKNAFAGVDAEIYRCRGLCSFYAEHGGLLVGFEKE